MNKLFKISLIGAVVVRLYLQLAAAWAIKFIPFKASFPNGDIFLIPKGPDWLRLWGNFDGVHYLGIAQEGYLYGLTQAFFPGYPLLIKWLSLIIHNQLIAGLLISHLCFIGFLYFFIKLGRLDYKIEAVYWPTLLLLLFPTSWFFFSVYTESLFLFLSALSLYLARTRRFAAAALVAGLASGTRLVGLFLLPAILWEYLRAVKKPKLYSVILLSLAGLSGLLLYLNFLQQKFSNFLIFITVQPGFGAGRQIDKIVMLYQVIFRYLKMLFTVNLGNEIYPVLLFELLMTLIAIGMIIYGIIKKVRLSYLIFVIPTLLLPTFTGSFASMPRYVLTGFPLFYLIGNLKSKRLKIIILVISFILLNWAFIRFSRGYWVS